MITITEITDLAPAHALRRAVFMDEQGYSAADEFDDLDGAAIHLLASDGTAAVGTARLFIDATHGTIGRVCVAHSHRGRGLGAQIMRDAMARLKASGCTTVDLGAQIHAVGFYETLGFEAYGAEYMDGAVPHVMMRATI